jgi:hypothetical protein
MDSKRGKRVRKHLSAVSSVGSAAEVELKPVAIETSIGHFVCYEDDTPYTQYFIFRPDHDRMLAEIRERRHAGEEISLESWQRISRFGVLMLALDELGFTADLYLDRRLVRAEEVETLIQGTLELLERIPLRRDGGSLCVYWMEEIAEYTMVESLPAGGEGKV